MALTRRQKNPNVYAGCPVNLSTRGFVTGKNTALTVGQMAPMFTRVYLSTCQREVL
jgi:hypothetical protein